MCACAECVCVCVCTMCACTNTMRDIAGYCKHPIRFINARIRINLVRAMNRCIRGSSVPTMDRTNRFRWEGGAGLGLVKFED